MIQIQKINPTPKILLSMFEAKEINFDLPMQRGYVWRRDKKSYLILSSIQGYPIPPLYANKVRKVYYVVDGQQRGRTLISFLLNKFALSVLPPVEIGGEIYNLSGKKFEDLPEIIQEKIASYNLDLHFGENLTDEEQKEMFIRLNSGKPLSATEMTKAQIKSVVEVTALGKHSVFKKIMNEKGMEASKNTSLIMQTYIVLFENYKCLLSSAIKKALGESQINIEQQNHIKQCLDTFEIIYNQIQADKSDVAKKLLLIFKRKSHFISFIYVISYAIESGNCNVDVLNDWIKHFFDCEVDQTTTCEEYNQSLKQGMNSDESVRIRLEAMLRDYQKCLENRGGNCNVQ